MQDAVPKKRGPKTEVLEELMKRVSGLEKRLQDERKQYQKLVEQQQQQQQEQRRGEGRTDLYSERDMSVDSSGASKRDQEGHGGRDDVMRELSRTQSPSAVHGGPAGSGEPREGSTRSSASPVQGRARWGQQEHSSM